MSRPSTDPIQRPSLLLEQEFYRRQRCTSRESLTGCPPSTPQLGFTMLNSLRPGMVNSLLLLRHASRCLKEKLLTSSPSCKGPGRGPGHPSPSCHGGFRGSSSTSRPSMADSSTYLVDKGGRWGISRLPGPFVLRWGRGYHCQKCGNHTI